jgi:hypothetical protein
MKEKRSVWLKHHLNMQYPVPELEIKTIVFNSLNKLENFYLTSLLASIRQAPEIFVYISFCALRIKIGAKEIVHNALGGV